MIEERIAHDHMLRELQWTECVAVGSEGFVRSIESRIQGRRRLEATDLGGRWVLREAALEYRVQVTVDKTRLRSLASKNKIEIRL
jgi:hypothetical protein